MTLPSQTRVVVLLAPAAYLIFTNLAAAPFVDEEAEVAVLSKNLLSHGELTAWDGRNLVVPRQATLDAALISRQPPAMFYLTALAFYWGGATPWAARLPHAALGLVTLVLLFWLLRRQFPDDPRVAIYGVVLLGGSVQFLLSVRQCRYDSACMAAALACFMLYRRCRERDGFVAYGALAVAAAALFFSHYLVAAAFFSTCAIVHLASEARLWRLRRHLKLGGVVLLFFVLVAPYTLAHTLWYHPWLTVYDAAWTARLTHAAMALRDVNCINALPLWAVLAALGVCIKAPAWRRRGATYLAVAIVNAVFAGLLAPLPAQAPTAADAGYLAACLPFAAAGLAVGAAWLHKHARLCAMGLTGALLATNVGSVPHAWTYELLLPRYVREIHRRAPPTAEQAAAEAILAQAQQDDLVMTTPSPQSLPMLFYAGDKVRICCLLDGTSPLVKAGAGRYAPHLLQQNSFPDWIVAFGRGAELDMALAYMSRPHETNGVFAHYAYAATERLDVYFDSPRQSELPIHTFGPHTDYNLEEHDVTLYQRRIP